MNDKLIDELTKIEMEEKAIKRNLDRYYRDERCRTRCYYRLRDLKHMKERLKFKIRLEKELKNENNNQW